MKYYLYADFGTGKFFAGKEIYNNEREWVFDK
jgi:hypothetical protein